MVSSFHEVNLPGSGGGGGRELPREREREGGGGICHENVFNHPLKSVDNISSKLKKKVSWTWLDLKNASP